MHCRDCLKLDTGNMATNEQKITCLKGGLKPWNNHNPTSLNDFEISHCIIPMGNGILSFKIKGNIWYLSMDMGYISDMCNRNSCDHCFVKTMAYNSSSMHKKCSMTYCILQGSSRTISVVCFHVHKAPR